MGEQVIDLEGIANHRGSAFGAIGMPPQPTSEHFANMVYSKLALADSGKRLFLEDESRSSRNRSYARTGTGPWNSPLVAVVTDAEPGCQG
ncbi:MAG: hypothetical protein R2727_06440 [Bacteroidales bacterium]